MNGRTILSGAFLLLVGAAVGWWVLTLPPAGSAKPAKPPLPATVKETFKEDQANVVVLTPKALEQLNLKTAPVQYKKAPRSRVYGGEVMVPPGQTIVVSAPLGGTLASPNGAVVAGKTVKKGDKVFMLSPLLTPEGRVTLATVKVDTEGQVETAQATFDNADIALKRAKRLLERDAGTRTRVEDAQAAYDVAKKALDAAKARLATLEKIAKDSANDRATPMAIEAPDDGMLRSVSAQPGQNVPAGAALFEVVNIDRVWVRTPVYVGDLHSGDPRQPSAVDQKAAALVAPLVGRAGGGQTARRASAPPSANPATGTVDLFYELDNRDGSGHRYRPGERVGVTVPLEGEEKYQTVPWAAVLFDVYGGAWVYESLGGRKFMRHRVLVQYVYEEKVKDEKEKKEKVIQTAVLKYGPYDPKKMKEPPQIVYTEMADRGRASVGPAELWGAETGYSR
jgi:biotin carboxyl carrier protein